MALEALRDSGGDDTDCDARAASVSAASSVALPGDPTFSPGDIVGPQRSRLICIYI